MKSCDDFVWFELSAFNITTIVDGTDLIGTAPLPAFESLYDVSHGLLEPIAGGLWTGLLGRRLWPAVNALAIVDLNEGTAEATDAAVVTKFGNVCVKIRRQRDDVVEEAAALALGIVEFMYVVDDVVALIGGIGMTKSVSKG